MRKSSNLEKRILLGVTGSVAAFRSLELLRKLVKNGFVVDVVLTEGAELFLTPLSFTSLTNGNVYPSGSGYLTPFAHLDLAKGSQLIVVCPATANTLNKIANGIADNLLTSVLIASTARKIVCPAMNVNMYRSQQVQDSLKKLRNMGYIVIEPQKGQLACGDEGEGKLAPLEEIFATIMESSEEIELIQGLKVLVVSGPTREWIDEVRFISNASSGLMGTALAAEAKSLGAEVVFITGPCENRFYLADKILYVESAKDMYDAVMQEIDDADVLVMAAAVADFTVRKHKGKVKKEDIEKFTLELEPTVDILREAGSRKKNGQIFVGFSLETDNLLDNALTKLKKKNLDIIVANSPESFSKDITNATIIRKDGTQVDLEKVSKRKIAMEVFKEVARLRKLSR
ncbi:MAG: bifunctional phosphopantothenoylcysteine decarboxylase/phosphopantothenate--cysteine ligase CoaBC [Actinobacteria bacterium]|nr:bifunctional phosphopantothenoylcysteine decarboxylase/phosphopantothenate--cysteine ligase CoaBC [Actinomycetota bacterium]